MFYKVIFFIVAVLLSLSNVVIAEYQWPVKEYKTISGVFGEARNNGTRWHAGVDISTGGKNVIGTKVYPLIFGEIVLPKHGDDLQLVGTGDYEGIVFHYKHISPLVSEGTFINAVNFDQPIAKNIDLERMDEHLHLEMIDAETFNKLNVLSLKNGGLAKDGLIYKDNTEAVLCDINSSKKPFSLFKDLSLNDTAIGIGTGEKLGDEIIGADNFNPITVQTNFDIRVKAVDIQPQRVKRLSSDTDEDYKNKLINEQNRVCNYPSFGKFVPYKICFNLYKKYHNSENLFVYGNTGKCNIVFNELYVDSTENKTNFKFDGTWQKSQWGSLNILSKTSNYASAFFTITNTQINDGWVDISDPKITQGFYDLVVWAEDFDGSDFDPSKIAEVGYIDNFTNVKKQTIYIKNGNTQDQYESDDSKAEATTITSGQTQHHNFHNSTDKDWYKFSVDSYSLVFIKTQGSESDRDTRLTIYNDDNNTWSFVTDTTYDRVGKNPTEYAEAVAFLQPGNYSFVVDGKGSMFDYETLFFSFPECFFHSQSQSLSGAASNDFLTTFAQEGTCNPVLKSPLPLSPGNIPYEDFETISTVQPTLHWDHGINCREQALYISEYPYGPSHIIYQNEDIAADQTSLLIPSGVLEAGKKYRWDLQSIDAFGNFSESSHNLYFRISSSTLEKADLALVSPTFSSFNLDDGQLFGASIKVKNIGAVQSSATIMQFGLSSSSNCNDFTLLSGQRNISPLDVNQNEIERLLRSAENNWNNKYLIAYLQKSSNEININNNCYVYGRFSIDNSETEQPQIRVYNIEIDDDSSGDSSGDNDGRVELDERVEFDVKLKNIGLVAGSNVIVRMEANNNCVGRVDAYENYGTVNAGTITSSQDFVFDFDQCSDGQEIVFNLDISADGGYTWSESYEVTLHDDTVPPEITFRGFRINDDDSGSDGNNDGQANPGENIEVFITVKNIGNTGAEDVRGFLRRKKSRVQGLI